MRSPGVDVVRGAIPAGTRVDTLAGVVVVGRRLPAPPAGFRRCWWCCVGRLIAEDDESEAEHRFLARPELVDGARYREEREAVEDAAVREEARLAGGAAAGRSAAASALSRMF